MRISNARARFTTSRPMLPSPMTPSVLPRSSLPRNFFFSHLPALRGSARLRNGARHRKHQRDRVLRDRNGIAARRIHHQHAGGGGGRQIHVVDAHAGAADHAQLRRLLQHVRRHLHGAAHHQRVGIAPDASRILSDWKRSRSSPAGPETVRCRPEPSAQRSGHSSMLLRWPVQCRSRLSGLRLASLAVRAFAAS